jgi:hypothetical protein
MGGGVGLREPYGKDKVSNFGNMTGEFSDSEIIQIIIWRRFRETFLL